MTFVPATPSRTGLAASYAQEGVALSCALAPRAPMYTIPIAFALRGRLDCDRLDAAFRALPRRHAALRTRFAAGGDGLVQIVESDARLVPAYHDLRDAAGDPGAVRALLEAVAREPFDLATPPLARVAIVRARDDEHVVLLVVHHIVGDAASFGVLLRDAGSMYGAAGAGSGETVRTLFDEGAYALACERERREGVPALASEHGDTAAFWRETLAEAPVTSQFPADGRRRDDHDFAGGTYDFEIPAPLTEALRGVARRYGVSLFGVLLAAHAIVLARYAGQDDVVVGVPATVRDAETRNLVGMFVNMIPVRVGLRDGMTFAGVLAAVRQRLAAALERRAFPFARILDAVQPVRRRGQPPIFQTVLNYRGVDYGEWDGLRVEPHRWPATGCARFEFSLSFEKLGGGLRSRIEYATALFDPPFVEAIAQSTEALLRGVAADPECGVERLPLLSEAGRMRTLVEWNATESPPSADRCLHELFEAQAMRSPSAVAVAYEDARLTYADLNAQANRLARYLRTLGVGPDVRVALCVERSPEMVVAVLAVLKAGGAYVPLDPGSPLARLRSMLEACAPAAALMHAATPASVRELLRESVPAAIDLVDDASRWGSLPDGDPDRAGLTPAHLAYVIYTSGSTGRPKGVMVEHRALCSYLQSARDLYAPYGGSVVSSSLSFDATVTSVYAPLLCGGAVRLLRPNDEIDGLEACVRDQRGCGLVKITPAHLDVLGRRLAQERARSSVGVFVVGGEALSPQTVALWRGIQPQVRIVNEYGPTEATVGCAVYDVPDGIPLRASVPIGRPLPNTRLYVLDRHGEPVPPGVTGELHIGGAQVARGYLGEPELTAERFVPSPLVEGDRLYRSGDLARYQPDGTLEFLGRNDGQMKIRGFRIEPGEIEAALAQHSAVRQAVVVSHEDDAGDGVSGEKRLVAYYTRAGSRSASAGELRSHLLSRLPEYMVPAAYVRLDELPITPNGKVDRGALPAPDDAAYPSRVHEPPRGEIEEAIAQVWCEVLRRERIGRRDDFFELGGHSLSAVRVLSRLRVTLGKELALSAFFADPTVKSLAASIGAARGSVLPPIEPADRDGPLLPSFGQQRLWLLTQIEGASRAYHIPLALRLRGPLDRVALRRALDRVIARHDALRMSFALDGAELVQRIAPATTAFPMTEEDWSGARGSSLEAVALAEAALAEAALEEVAAPFDLMAGPLIRGRLVRLDRDDHALIVAMHHVVSDGWSVDVLLRELSALYTAHRAGDEEQPAPLAIQYADYAAWQRRWLTGDVLKEQSAYWRRALAGAPTLLELPTDHARPPRQDHAGGRVPVECDAELTSALRALSRRHGTTPFVTVLSAWALVLARLSGQDEVVVGTPVANRPRAELEELIGYFVNTLALRLDCSTNPSVGEFLQRVKARTLEAQENQDLPFEQVVELVNPSRSLAHTPLFQVMFAWQSDGGHAPELPDLQVSRFDVPATTAKFDLSLALRETSGRITGSLEYATALFDRTTAERYAGYLRNALRAMAEDDARPVMQLPLLDEPDRHRVLVEWNATEVSYGTARCVHELIEARAAESPDAVAVMYEDVQVSASEMNAQANRLARHLRARGVGPDVRVAVCIERSVELVVALLAVLKAGGAYVPLDPSYPADRLRYMLEDSAPAVLLIHPSTADHMRQVVNARDDSGAPGSSDSTDASGSLGLPGSVGLPDSSAARDLRDAPAVIDVVDDAARWETGSASDLDRDGLTPSHLAYVIYTSGSSGRPKGVMNEHGAVVNRLLWAQSAYGLDASDRVLQKTPFGFDVSVWELFWPLLSGATLVMARPEGHKDPGYLTEVIRTHGITTIHFVPSMLQAFLDHEDASRCTSLRRVICSGEALSGPLARRVRECLPGAVLSNLYGPTEAAVDVTAFLCDDAAPFGDSVPIGKPIANTRTYVLDRHEEPVPVGVAGELHIGGVQVARGYLNRSDLTAERFVANPFVQGDRLYKSGDVARYRVDGTLEFLGRNDFQVKLRGLRIELGEIESRLAEHPEVSEAVVVAHTLAGEQRLVAYYTPRTSQADAIDATDVASVNSTTRAVSVSGEALRAHLLAVLPEYMVPAAYVGLAALPLTPNGKLDRAALPAPGEEAYAGRADEPPQGEREETIARIWCEVLHRERVGRNDDFFELGGHSLSVLRVIARVREALGKEVGFSAFFAGPTVAAIAETLRGANRSALPPIERADRTAPLALSFAQQRLCLLSRLDGAGRAYHVPLGLRLRGELDREALLAALDDLVARHEALRTTFPVLDDEPVQRIASEPRPFVLEEHDVRGSADAASVLDALTSQEARTAFDLAAGPLMRGRLMRLGDDDHVLLLTMHHIISDGWSLDVIMRELRASYAAHRARDHEPPVPLPIQYADYAAWQRRWLSGDVLREQSAYWKRTLTGAPALLELPTDRPRPPQQDHTGARAPVELDAELTSRLHALNRRNGTTPFMTLAAAWAIVLSRLSGQSEVVIGTPVANRPRTELEGLVGYFVNTLALRFDCSANPSAGEFLRWVRTAVLDAQEHQDLPFEQVVELINPPRTLAHAPLFQTMFSWRSERFAEPEWPGLDVRRFDVETGTAKFDLSLALGERDGRMTGSVEYATALFDRSTVDRYVEYLKNVLDAMTADDATTIEKLPLISETERTRLLVEWNATGAPYRADRCLHELFEEQAARSPDALAVLCDDAQLTYGELNAQANRLARHLRSLGVGADVRVALCAERSPEMVVALLAVLKAGGAYVPLDPSYPHARLRFMLDDGAPVVVLTHGERSAAVREMLRNRPVVGSSATIDLVRDAAGWSNTADSNLDRGGVTPAHPAYVIYTSGSTGRPKGVIVEHRALTAYLQSACELYAPHRGSVVSSSLSFDATVTSLYAPLLTGGALRLLNECDEITGLEACVRDPRGCGLVKITPAHLDVLGRRLAEEHARPAVGVFVVGGDVLPSHTVDLWRTLQPHVRIVNEYGPTEATVGCAVYDVPEGPSPRSAIPIGRPLPNVRLYVLDAHRAPVPIGVTGELFIGGPQVARGYLGRPHLTAERFVASPFVDGDRLYRTGDLARYRSDCTLEFLGRNDSQMKIRGFRIEPGEIEAALAEHPAVREAVVLAFEDVPGEKRLVAYCTRADSVAPSAEELRSHLLSRLPEYMVPAAYVQLDALPLTPNGKLDRSRLPIPGGDAYAARDDDEPPYGELERNVAEIWCDVLRRDRVGRRNDFFALGGHSLLAVRVLSRLRQTFGKEIGLSAFFAGPTVAEVARALSRAGGRALPPIEPADRATPLRASFAQQRLWLLSRIDGASRAYLIPLALRLRGSLDRTALGGALDRMLARHEALRTTFAMVDGEPVQHIGPAERGFLLFEVDVTEETDAASALDALALAETTAPFDPALGPLIRGLLVRLGETEHVLLITMHHIVSDGWSLGVFMHELSASYAALHAGDEEPPAPLAIQYADYAAWQRRWLTGDVLKEQSAYWQRALSGAPTLLELPADRARPSQGDYAGARVGVEFDAALTERVRALSRRHGTTPFMTVLSAWAVVLARLSGQDEVVVGMPVANRPRPELEELIGYFVNTLALRLDCSSNPSVGEFLQRVKTRTLEAQENQDLPFEQVVELVNPPRGLAHTPLFQVMFTWQSDDPADVSLPELDVSRFEIPATTAKFDLSLGLRETGGRITGSLEYATALFDRTTVERYATYLEAALGAMTSDDEARIEYLRLVSDADRHRMLVEWNATEVSYGAARCVHELIEARAAESPAAVAVVYEDVQLSAGDLKAQANRLARHLRARGVGPDVRVAVCIERSAELVVALLAVLKAGGAYVPLDPSYPADRLRYMLEDSAPAVVLIHPSTADRMRQVVNVRDMPVIIDVVDDAVRWKTGSASDLDRNGLTPSHLAYVIYTSGSSGRPKGVMNEHGAVVNRLLWAQSAYKLDSTDRVLQKTPVGFDVSVWELFWPLLSGATLIMARPEGHKDPGYLADVIQTREITTIHFVPSMLQAFLDHEDAPQCTSLRRVICSGEALSGALARRLRERLPNTVLSNLYGPTEAAVDVTALVCNDALAFGDGVPIGKPIANTHTYVLDRHGEPVPVGVAGELHIGGVQVARGYLNRPDLTAERFVASPFIQGDRLYKTGDVARYRADGTLEFLGRNDFQVKLRGLRIELGEIESRLAEHPAVSEAVVVARAIAGEQRLVAYYTPRTSQADAVDPIGPASGNGSTRAIRAVSASGEALRAYLLAVLPEHMVPAAYVGLAALPLTPNGKLDRAALPAPGEEAYAGRADEPPQGELEETIAGIWCEVLHRERVGRNDDFFELGGHSLSALQVSTRVSNACGIVFGLPAALMCRTVADQAQAVADAPRSAGSQASREWCRRPGERHALSFAQERIWFLQMLEPDSSAYHISVLAQVGGPLDDAALRRAVGDLLERHEMLRTTFAGDADGPYQIVHDTLPAPFEVVAPESTHSERAGEVVAALARERVRRPFALRAESPLRVVLFRGEDECYLLVVLHHLAGDGWSLRLLLRDLAEFYARSGTRASHGEAALKVQYAGYADTLRDRTDRASVDADVAYWVEKLGGSARLDLPRDVPAAPSGDRVRGSNTVFLERDTVTRLRALAAASGATPFEIVMAALVVLLSRLGNQDDVLVGFPVVNRDAAELEDVVGLFLNTLVLRADLSDARTFVDVLRHVGAEVRDAYAHQNAPFELVVERLNPERRLDATPIFDVMLNFQERPLEEMTLGGAPVTFANHHLAVQGKFALVFYVFTRGDAVRVDLAHDAQRFSDERAKTILAQFESLLAQVVTAPQAATRSYSLALGADAELRRPIAAPGYPPVHELIQRKGAEQPGATAIVQGGATITYDALARRAERLARRLVASGSRPGDVVAVSGPRGIGFVVALLGVLRSGATVFPLDPSLPAARREQLLSIAKPVRIVSADDANDLAADAAHERDDADLPEIADAVPAYLFFTSGTTGTPQGVLGRHSALSHFLVWQRDTFGIAPGDRCAQTTNASFDVMLRDTLLALVSGAELVIPEPADERGGRALFDWIERRQITVLHAVPTLFQSWLFDAAPGIRLRALRWLFFAGEPLKASLVEAFRETFPEGAEIVNLYGPTETTLAKCWYLVPHAPLPAALPVGRPLPHCEAIVMRDGVPCGAGEPGEIVLRTPFRSFGYLGERDRASSDFFANPWRDDPDDLLYRTGDLGRLRPDGELDVLGRRDHQVKISGVRVQPAEVERALTAHPDVAAGVVTALADEHGETRLVAYAVRRADSAISAEGLRAFLADRLPGAMVPNHYVFIERVPTTPNGKPDLAALPAPAPRRVMPLPSALPATTAQRAVAALWTRVLGCPTPGVHENFFELGGTSLRLLRLHSLLGDEYPAAALRVAQLFTHPTIAGQAALLEPEPVAAAIREETELEF